MGAGGSAQKKYKETKVSAYLTEQSNGGSLQRNAKVKTLSLSEPSVAQATNAQATPAVLISSIDTDSSDLHLFDDVDYSATASTCGYSSYRSGATTHRLRVEECLSGRTDASDDPSIGSPSLCSSNYASDGGQSAGLQRTLPPIEMASSIRARQRANLTLQVEEFKAEQADVDIEKKESKKKKGRKHRLVEEHLAQLNAEHQERDKLGFESEPPANWASDVPSTTIWASESPSKWDSESPTDTRGNRSPSFVQRRRAQIREHRMQEYEASGSNSGALQQQSSEGSLPRLSPPSSPSQQTSKRHDDAMCGFLEGDTVTAKHGPDAAGPWTKLGNGLVSGPDPHKRGFLTVQFQASGTGSEKGEVFSIKASNLINLTSPHRSPLNAGRAKVVTEKESLASEKKTEKRVGFNRSGGETNFNVMGGLKIGDRVTGRTGPAFMCLSDGGHAVVVGVGDIPGAIKVQYGDLGSVMDVKASDVMKVSVDKSKPTGSQNVKDFFQQFRGERPRSNSIDPCRDIKIGDYVRVVNEKWAVMGLGCVRELGNKEGTVKVQFDSGGDTWVMDIEDLQKEEPPDRHFRQVGVTKKRGEAAKKFEEKIARKVQMREKQSVVELPNVQGDPLAKFKEKLLDVNEEAGVYTTSYAIGT